MEVAAGSEAAKVEDSAGVMAAEPVEGLVAALEEAKEVEAAVEPPSCPICRRTGVSCHPTTI